VVAQKPDSQEICFVPDGDYARFIEQHAASSDEATRLAHHPTEGLIVNQTGSVLGQHSGVHHFTVGQRKGLGLATGAPLYVLELRPVENQVVVGPREALEDTTLTASGVNWISGTAPSEALRIQAQIRHRHTAAGARVHALSDNRAELEFDTPQTAITPGQAVVFYDDDLVVGGGWID
jgi:tRNA-specific 2-thiouridylase